MRILRALFTAQINKPGKTQPMGLNPVSISRSYPGREKNEEENFKLLASGEKSNKEKPVKTSGQNKNQNNPIFFSSS